METPDGPIVTKLPPTQIVKLCFRLDDYVLTFDVDTLLRLSAPGAINLLGEVFRHLQGMSAVDLDSFVALNLQVMVAANALRPISSNKTVEMVARDGIEPPTRGFSVRCSTS